MCKKVTENVHSFIQNFIVITIFSPIIVLNFKLHLRKLTCLVYNTGNKCHTGLNYILGGTGKTQCAKTQGVKIDPRFLCLFLKICFVYKFI